MASGESLGDSPHDIGLAHAEVRDSPIVDRQNDGACEDLGAPGHDGLTLGSPYRRGRTAHVVTMAGPVSCAACGLILDALVYRSFYFARPLCRECFDGEESRTKAQAEVILLDQLYRMADATGRV